MMKPATPKQKLVRRPRRLDAALVGIVCAAFLAAVFVLGLRLAKTISNNSAAIKTVSEQRRYPLIIQSVVESVQDRLNSHGFVQTPLDQLRQDTAALSAALDEIAATRNVGWFDVATGTVALAQPPLKQSVLALRDEWATYRQLLQPLLDYKGVPFHDSETSGTRLNEAGQVLAKQVSAALRAAHKTMPQLDSDFGKIGAQLETVNARTVANMSLVMFAGVLFAATFVALAIGLHIARQGQEDAAREAQRQSDSIFRNMKEGLFLLDKHQVIGPAHSSAMNALFKRDDIAGLPFEQLLKGIVPEKTLNTAMKYVNVLWSERTKENLVKTINPLGEVEVHIDKEGGDARTQYLEFDFHRVRTDEEISHILVSVFDVSARVALASELKGAQEKTQAQIDTLLSLVQVDPAQLASFMGDSDSSMQMINAILREPAREEPAFRKKLDSIFRQVHSVKGEAAAIGLVSIESRAHTFEEDLRALREKSTLSGNDFLPLIVKLDDLFNHMQSIRDLVTRLSRLQLVSRLPESGRKPPQRESAAAQKESAEIGPMLDQLAGHIAGESGKTVRVRIKGFESVPAVYRRAVKDIAIQAVRNAVVHGIETAPLRTSAGKEECGVIHIELTNLGGEGYRLSIEDDGQGLATERIVAAAVQRGIVNPEDASTLNPKQVLQLLFRSGISTAEQDNKNAGRGVGMSLIAEIVKQSGGKLGVSTAPGKFTRFTIFLPSLQSRDAQHQVA